MKFSSALFVTFATFIASVSSHVSMSFPPTRGHPLNENAAIKDFDCILAPLNGGSGCAPKPFPCGGYPKDNKVVTTFQAGEVFSAKFFNSNFPELREEDKTKDQARHNGGLCEFALSYDGGQNYTVIATYKKTCPDIFFDGWKVRIPENAPSCDDCILSWSWINAVGNREFYQNCADIKIEGDATEPLPIIDITRANLPPLFEEIVTPEGDDLNTGNASGSGPREEDVEANLALTIGDEPKTKSPDTPETENPKNDTPKQDDKPKEQTPKTPNDGQDSNEAIPCNENGSMVCDDEGVSAEFFTCDNGRLVSRSCPGILVCAQNGKSIFCDYPKKR